MALDEEPDDDRPALLILRALGLGDLLAAFPALRGLSAAFPDHRKVLATPAPLHGLALASGAIDEVVHAEPLTALPRSVVHPAVAVNLHGRGPQSHRVLLATRPRHLIAWRHPDIPETGGGPQWRADEHEVERWCRLLASSDIATDPGRLELQPPARPVPPSAAGATILHPGASSKARRWPVERWAAVARAEIAAGRRVVVTGDDDELPLARTIAALARLDDEAVVAGRTDLCELAAIVAAAARVVCGDTGVAHLATALGTPSVVLFGPTPPKLWGPPPRLRDKHRVLWHNRTGDPHGTRHHPGLLDISVPQVLDELASL